MARITPSFTETPLPTSTPEEGYAGIEMNAPQLVQSFTGEKPAIVYFFDPRQKSKNDRLEGVIFRNEVIGTGSRGFSLLKVDVTKIQRDELRAEYSKNTPKFHFFSHEGDLLAKVEDSVTAPLFQSAITKAFNAEYAMPLDKFVKQHRQVLDRLDRAEGKKRQAEEKRKLLTQSDRNDARTAKLLKEVDADVQAAEDEEKKILEDEKSLLESLKLKLAAKN